MLKWEKQKGLRGLALWMAVMAGAASVAGCGQRENKERQEEKPAPQEIAGEKQGTLTGGAEEEQQAFAPEQEETAAEDGVEPTDKAEEFLSSMTLEQKIHQMFVITPEQLMGYESVTEMDDTTKERFEQYPVGGVICFAENLCSAEQTRELLADMQSTSYEVEGLPLFLCVDEEGGRVARIGNNPSFAVEKVGPMAKVSSLEEAYACGNVIGQYLHELGFNVDFAPDADVLTNPENTVIGDRSFGTDAEMVTEYATAYSDGLHANDVLSCFKHFPGHGATKDDTHKGYAYSDKTYEELAKAELVPFVAAEEAGADMVMVAHIALPNVTGEDTPCSLSYQMITEILRGDLEYEGLVITDALNMGAIAETYDSGEAALMAVEAGVDLLLMPEDVEEAYAAIYAAVQGGEVTEERIDESVRRILEVKLGE